MISPNFSVIMDSTATTTSSYIDKEGNPQSDRISSNVGNSTNGLAENELLEDQNPDLEDDDTFSDDSLRLRLSDDEGESEQAGTMDEPVTSCVSSEQTTSRNIDMGMHDSRKEIAPGVGLESTSDLNKTELKKDRERSTEPDNRETLGENCVNSEMNSNTVWPGKLHRSHLSNFARSPIRSLRGHSFRSRHSYNSVNPPYFNVQNNFGHRPGYRNQFSRTGFARGKFFRNGTRQPHRNLANAQSLKAKPKRHLNSDAKTGLTVSDQTSAEASLSATHTCFNGFDNTDKTVLLHPTDSNSEKSSNNKSDTNIFGVNSELSKECSHLNLYDKPSSVIVDTKKLNSDLSEWRCSRDLSQSYDARFCSDDWFDVPHVNDFKAIHSTEDLSMVVDTDPSFSERDMCISPDEDGEFSQVMENSKKEKENVIDEAPILSETDLSSIKLPNETETSEIVSKSNNSKLDSDAKENMPCDVQETVKANSDSRKSDEDANALEKLQNLCSEVTTTVDDSEESQNLNSQSKNLIEHKEEKLERPSSPDKHELGEHADEKMSTKKTVKESTDDGDTLANEEKKNLSLDSKQIDGVENPNPLQIGGDKRKRKTVSGKASYETSDSSEQSPSKKSLAEPEQNEQLQFETGKKRVFTDEETINEKLTYKKIKISPDPSQSISIEKLETNTTPTSPNEEMKQISFEKCQENSTNRQSLNYVRKFFQRDIKGKLTKLTREELEELLIQKVVETITMRTESGKLREQARISERNLEATRLRCQQLAKQIKDFDMVLSRNAVDRKANNDKPVPPIKINRSVGLQVNFQTEHGIQNLRGLAASNSVKLNVSSPTTVNGTNVTTGSQKHATTTAAPRRGIKVRSPRRASLPKRSSTPARAQTSPAKPTAVAMPKQNDSSQSGATPTKVNEQVSSNLNVAQSTAPKNKNIFINGKVSTQGNRPTAISNNKKPESSDLIDLTEEEDRNRSSASGTFSTLPMVASVSSTIGPKSSQNRFQRVGQTTIPGNVAITTQPNIRVVQSVSQPTPTALVNNINATRLAYVMQGNPGSGRQVLIAPNSNQIRPATSTTRGQFSGVTYKAGISTLANGAVRVLTTTAAGVTNSHPPPAPLPEAPHYKVTNGLKLPPPPPSLKISKVPQGIVLSWNMAQSDTYAEIASYQLYAYQETPGTPPSSGLWKKVGDVRALPLPMACTLKEFTPGNHYHFAVRAVDKHSRYGQYSIPRNISL